MNDRLDDDLFEEAPRRSTRAARPRRGDGRRGRGWLVGLLAVALVLGGLVLGATQLRGLLPGGGPDTSDYEGPGTGTVEVVVASGQSGADIGTSLKEADVVRSVGAFTSAAATQPDKASAIQPGTYTLKKQMRASDAFAALSDEANRVASGVTIAEGLWRSEIYQRLSQGTGVPVADYEKAESSADLRLPRQADGTIEGWLFPSTYEFDDDASALEQLNTMIERTVAELKKAKVSSGDWQRTLTIASIVEGEAGVADRAKVARVVENRLADPTGPTIGRLQMDSTANYALQKRGALTRPEFEKSKSSPFDTYEHAGLPPTPINNPGAAAIEATADPAQGPWFYFVTVDYDTGETLFATTLEEQHRNDAKRQKYCADNPGVCEGKE